MVDRTLVCHGVLINPLSSFQGSTPAHLPSQVDRDMLSSLFAIVFEATPGRQLGLGGSSVDGLPGLVNLQKTMENHHFSWENSL